jgi:hypothetical protein
MHVPGASRVRVSLKDWERPVDSGVVSSRRERREPPELDRKRLLTACGCPADEGLVEDVIDATYVSPDEAWPNEMWLCTAVALRALLAPHQPTETVRCGHCATEWPCWTWREAHDWIGGYDPVHGGRVYDWIHHEAGAEDSVGLDPGWPAADGGLR